MTRRRGGWKGGGGVRGTQSGERRIEREGESGGQTEQQQETIKKKTGRKTTVHFLKLFANSVAVLLVHFCYDAEKKSSYVTTKTLNK